MPIKLLILFLAASLISLFTLAQSMEAEKTAILDYIKKNSRELGINTQDVQNIIITDRYTTKQNGIKHIHIAQAIGAVRISNATANFIILPDGEVRISGNRLVKGPSGKVKNSVAGLSAGEAINAAASQLGIISSEPLIQLEDKAGKSIYVGTEISSHEIPVELVYRINAEDEINLCWSVAIKKPADINWWHLFIDATSGELREKINWTSDCEPGNYSNHGHAIYGNHQNEEFISVPPPPSPGNYRVFPLPVESPSHGVRELLIEPASDLGSPFGWHDNNAADGAEFTYTRGNNVYAYEDSNDNDSPGYSPDGGAALNFDFPLDLSADPSDNYDPAITNLFYMNNRIHDIAYAYGFDEGSGNFQYNNYGNGGENDDDVFAEAQDGGGSSNANFATPPDGFNPVMQMYLWPVGENFLTVNSPPSLAGPYTSSPPAGFGAPLSAEPITADLVLALDGTLPENNELCNLPANGSEMDGKIVVLRRGNCDFTQKVLNAQEHGALAVLVVNNEEGGVIVMGGQAGGINIPSIMIRLQDGNNIIEDLENGITVNATLQENQPMADKDGDFDNGIIIHEYSHGISNRLTGGASNSDCLSNEEQMGEGWSDFFGLMLTTNLNSENPVFRPIGTYAVSQSVNGGGIRPAPYDTSFAVNPYTYGDVSNENAISMPHGIGFIWATMLWDLNWAFIEEYGYSEDIENGTAGNNTLLQLVIDGLKLQPCSPGFVDGRDAILLADEINNAGANNCLIWSVFAKRGLGYSASQGSPFSRMDQTEAFDLPPLCQVIEFAPIANFTATPQSTCDGLVQFTDQSVNIPQHWSWNFGDGTTDTIQNPLHQFSEPGIYSVSLEVTNTMGSEIHTETDYIVYELPVVPVLTDGSGCSSDSILLSGTATGIINWFDENLNLLHVGNQFFAAPSANTLTYIAINEIDYPSEYVGPDEDNMGIGANHTGTFVGTVDFETFEPLRIKSAYVQSAVAGVRTINLYDGFGGTGNIIDQKVVNIDFTGGGRIELGFVINNPGTYSIGLNFANLFRTLDDIDYPFVLEDKISIVGSSAGQDYYYYFYDLEIDKPSCFSEAVEATATVVDIIDFEYSVEEMLVSFTDLSPNATAWLWDFGDGNSSSEENPEHLYSDEGTYDVTLSVVTANGTCDYTQPIILGDGTSGLEDKNYSSGIQIFPNPAHSTATLKFEKAVEEKAMLSILSTEGRLVQRIEIAAGTEQIELNLNDLQQGMYFAMIRYRGVLIKEKLLIIN